MDRSVFNKIREIVYEKSGISLSEGKEALVNARVSKRMRMLGIRDYRAYLRCVLKNESGEEIVHLLDVISTNVTSFFREANHFDFLSEVFTMWLEQGQKRFRLWSVACSTGEEPYTIAMTLLKAAKGYNVDMKILATDISTRALAECRRGTYREEKLKTVPNTLIKRFFTKSESNGGVYYTVRSEMKNMIVFRRMNQSKPPYPMRGPLDVILCRNVMIYFDNAVRRKLLADMCRLLRPDGYLMVGHAESLTSMVSDFRAARPSIYMKQPEIQ